MNPSNPNDAQLKRIENLRAVAGHLSKATGRPAQASAASGQGKAAGLLKRWGPLGAALLFILGKSKWLLVVLKVAKFHTLLTMVLAVWVYAQIWGIYFAVGFVLLIFVHECGHALMMRQQGIPAGAPVFIPFVGAVIAMKGRPRDAYAEALVGLGGPVLGTAGAMICLLAGWTWQNEFWYALAYTGFMLNMFNMIPFSPLDGGRIVGVISRWLWVAGFLVGGIVFIKLRSPILLLILALGLFSFFKSLKNTDSRYYDVPRHKKLAMGAAYFIALFIMAVGMWLAHQPIAGLNAI